MNAWQVDDNNCIIQSSRLFPPQHYTSTTYTAPSPIQTNCNRIGTYVSCETTGGESYPITLTTDLNRANRAMAWESCIRALGYYPIGEKRVISEAEHKRAKEKITPQTDNTDTDKQLQELSELHKGGVVSEADYNKAKKRLAETQKLNELRQSGVLSEEEYNKAKARLKEK